MHDRSDVPPEGTSGHEGGEERPRFAADTAQRGERFALRILDNLFAFVGVLDTTGTVLDVNEAPLAAAGIRIDDVRGRKFWDCYWWSYEDAIRDQVRGACERAARGEVVRFDVTIRTAGDGRMTIDFQIAPLRDEAGRVTHVVPSAVDVTERKRAELELRRSERRLAELAARAESERAVLDAIFEAVPAGIILADAHGKLVRHNAANELIWGPAPPTESFDDFRAWKGWWADDSSRRGRRIEPEEWAMSRALRGETVRDDIVEIEPFDRPGTRRTMVNSAAPVRDGEGRIAGAVVAQMDITALVASESARRESEERLRALADNIPQLAWMADASGWAGWYNQRWFEFTGTTFEEMKGFGWRNVQHPDYVDAVTRKFLHHVETGDPWEDTFPLRGRDGEYRWFLSRAMPIRDERGRVVRWFGTNTDVTEQREARASLEKLTADLREAVKARDEFLSVASHELKTPVTSLKLQCQAVQRGIRKGDPSVHGPERLQRLVEQTDRQLARLTRLIDDMLDVGRIRAGRLTICRERLALDDLARDVVERLRPAMAHAGTPVSLACAERVEGDWDRFRIEQVVTNLLTNAMRYGERRPVSVEVTRADGQLARVVVRDRGRGIAPEARERIFDRFERAISPNEVSGLGLGLFISRQIVAAHGGRIWAESEGLGRGAAFVVELPCAR